MNHMEKIPPLCNDEAEVGGVNEINATDAKMSKQWKFAELLSLQLVVIDTK